MDGGVGIRATNTVTHEARIALKLGDGRCGPWAEDAVCSTGIESEGAEASLKASDVVTPHHRGAEIELSVAEAISGFDKNGPRQLVADPVDIEAVSLLEIAKGQLRCSTERSERIGFVLTDA